MKRRIAKKQMRRAECELVGALRLYLSRPAGEANEELARAVVGVTLMLVLSFREQLQRPCATYIKEVRLSALEAGHGSKLVGLGTLASGRNGVGGEAETAETFRVIFDLGGMTRRVPYVTQVGQQEGGLPTSA